MTRLQEVEKLIGGRKLYEPPILIARRLHNIFREVTSRLRFSGSSHELATLPDNLSNREYLNIFKPFIESSQIDTGNKVTNTKTGQSNSVMVDTKAKYVCDILEFLSQEGLEASEATLPESDKPLSECKYTYGAYSNKAMQKRIEWVCERVPATYDWIIEANFPTLRPFLECCQIYPFRYFVVFDGIEDTSRAGALDMYLEPVSRSDFKPEIHFSQNLDDFYKNDLFERRYRTRNSKPKMISQGRWANRFADEDILHEVVYDLIEEDFRELFDS